MSGPLYLAWRYLLHHRVKTAVLVTSVTLLLFVPGALRVLVAQGERRLEERARATPLLIGAKGSPLELVLNSLYFAPEAPEPMRYGHVEEVAATGWAQPIPLHVRFRAGTAPIVGTTLDYFPFRGLEVERGGLFVRLGDCVVGARVAEERDLEPGDHVISSPQNVFDLAGVYPLKMRVTGVLAASGGPDDGAVFVDIKTAWVIEGLAHGHQDLARPEAAAGVLERKEGEITANASVVQYNEITDENLASFHFHGDPADFPITAVIAVPPGHAEATFLQGRYLSREERHQILRPHAVVRELLGTIARVEEYVVAALFLVAAAALATAVLVFVLSLRLRRRELETMVKIGAARSRLAALVGFEILGVLAGGALLAGLLLWVASGYGEALLRAFLVGCAW